MASSLSPQSNDQSIVAQITSHTIETYPVSERRFKEVQMQTFYKTEQEANRMWEAIIDDPNITQVVVDGET